MEIKVVSVQKSTSKDNNSVIDHHVQCILKSGLLLDEDMDIILTHYTSDDEIVDKQTLTFFEKLLGALSITTTLLSFKRKFEPVITTITVTPLVILAIKRLIDKIRIRNQRRNIEKLVETVINITKLNRMIFDYFKHRKAIDPSTVSVINPYTKGMKTLIEIIFKEEVHLLYSFRIIIRQFANYVPSLKEDYAHLGNLDFDEFTNANISCVDDCVIYLQRLFDIYVLIISNVLTCLTLTLCPSLSKQSIKRYEVIETIVPKMKKLATNCYYNVYKKFDDVKYHYLNRREIKKHFKKPKPNASTKLQINTYNTMVHTTDILEKSQIIFKKLQEADLQSSEEKEILGKCILDLRGHVFDYYESLDVLYKLYQVNINASQNKPISSDIKVENKEEENVSKISIIDASLNPSEPSDDEEYELYIGANDAPSGNTSFSMLEEQESRKFASLLSQELKHKLKSHAQFAAARKKRGIVDEEPLKLEEKAEQETPFQQHVHESVEAKLLLPPPLPPPQPMPFRLDFESNDNQPLSVTSFLESVKAASKNRDHVEEVFGGDSDG